MNQTCKRFLMIALVLILTLPVAAGILFHASAATVSGLADTTIGLEYDKGSTDGATINWTASGNQITGSLLGASMGSNRYKAGDTTLTITNNRNAALCW